MVSIRKRQGHSLHTAVCDLQSAVCSLQMSFTAVKIALWPEPCWIHAISGYKF